MSILSLPAATTASSVLVCQFEWNSVVSVLSVRAGWALAGTCSLSNCNVTRQGLLGGAGAGAGAGAGITHNHNQPTLHSAAYMENIENLNYM